MKNYEITGIEEARAQNNVTALLTMLILISNTVNEGTPVRIFRDVKDSPEMELAILRNENDFNDWASQFLR